MGVYVIVQERWRRIIINHHYEVSDQGQVRRLTPANNTFAGKILKLNLNRNGYLVVDIRCGGRKTYSLHRLVAFAFIGNPPLGCNEINHIDGDKLNNKVDNLEWVSHSANMSHAANTGLMARGERISLSKLTAANVKEIRHRHDRGESQKVLSVEFGVASSGISRIVNRLMWGHVK